MYYRRKACTVYAPDRSVYCQCDSPELAAELVADINGNLRADGAFDHAAFEQDERDRESMEWMVSHGENYEA